jgi:hypothetical protein
MKQTVVVLIGSQKFKFAPPTIVVSFIVSFRVRRLSIHKGVYPPVWDVLQTVTANLQYLRFGDRELGSYGRPLRSSLNLSLGFGMDWREATQA